MVDPPIEALLDCVDSKFTLVTLSAKRARQINSYFNQLGEGLGTLVPPQVASLARKPLSIALEEIAAGKVQGYFPILDEELEDLPGDATEVVAGGHLEVVPEPSVQSISLEDDSVDQLREAPVAPEAAVAPESPEMPEAPEAAVESPEDRADEAPVAVSAPLDDPFSGESAS
jgi:DNA-directed RNA polymerase subunit omega